LAKKAAKATTIAEEKLKFFKEKCNKMRALLKEIEAQATNYLYQLSFTS
jgi:hypothetical protein